MNLPTKIVLNEKMIPHLEIDFMNNTHFEEIKMVKLIGKLISSYQKNDTQSEEEINQITCSLEEWLDHTRAHFTRENTLMMEINFPAYPIHSGEHEKVLTEMTSIVEEWKKNNDIEALVDYVFYRWPSWFDQHVNSMDMMTAKIAVMHGFDPHSLPQQQDQ